MNKFTGTREGYAGETIYFFNGQRLPSISSLDSGQIIKFSREKISNRMITISMDKQKCIFLVLNRRKLPLDIIRYIMDFCYFRFDYENLHKFFMAKIVDKFLNAELSRINHRNIFSDDSEHWAISLFRYGTDHSGEESDSNPFFYQDPSIEGVNCKKCGNYKCCPFGLVSKIKKIQCHCNYSERFRSYFRDGHDYIYGYDSDSDSDDDYGYHSD